MSEEESKRLLSAITLAPAPAKGAECAEAGAGAAAETNITIDAAAADDMEEGTVVEEVDEEGGGDADNETDGSPGCLPGTPVVRDVGSFVGQVDHPTCVHGCVYAWMYVYACILTHTHACSRMHVCDVCVAGRAGSRSRARARPASVPPLPTLQQASPVEP